ncbi:hypothetical protein [Campylobacter ureolyticus]|uniref:hypothetical protein n=1 Tax=Campylobacter ureolyticus TaxID=827 RepID=UPI0029107F24|nr:hypothetical protein [Campylobacter ureolyticus]MDU7070689.1 hypothetical protein [Campylobacter ureolyticus]
MNDVIIKGVKDENLTLLKSIAKLLNSEFIVKNSKDLSRSEFEELEKNMLKLANMPKNLEVLKRLKDR